MQKLTKLSKVMERVENMSVNHVDRYIKSKEISFDNLNSVRIGSEPHILRPVAQQAFANRLGIPIQYLKRCPEDIQAYNMNYWITHEKNDELFFRFDGNEVRAIFTPRYIPTDNFEILQKLDAIFDAIRTFPGAPDTQPGCAHFDDAFRLGAIRRYVTVTPARLNQLHRFSITQFNFENFKK